MSALHLHRLVRATLCALLAANLWGCLDEDDPTAAQDGGQTHFFDACGPSGCDGPDRGPPSQDDAAQPPATTCLRSFVYRPAEGHSPAEVTLAGSFEDWRASLPMQRRADGRFLVETALAEGPHRYKFVVDGEWLADPDNPRREEDGQGGENSLIEHACPFEPECLDDARCPAQAPLCRDYTCRTVEEACQCPEGLQCDAQGHCVEAPECDEATPCEAPLVCRAGRCAPECLDDGDCTEGDLCRELQCLTPECADDTQCDPLAQRCDGALCVEKRCATQIFTYDPQGIDWDAVHLAGDFTAWEAEWISMEWRPELGLWTARVDLENGSYLYKFVLSRGAEQTWIVDPASIEAVEDGFGGQNSVRQVLCSDEPGASQCGDVGDFDWRDAVMYFALTDRFHDSDGQRDPVPGVSDGAQASGQYVGGDLQGLTAKLGYLEDLGVSALWMSAPYKNRDLPGAAVDPHADPHIYSGYHGYWPKPENIDYSDPQNPSPRPQVESRIGSAADLHALVDGAHARGIHVLFDYVMNHVDADSGLYRAHPDWFVHRDDGSLVLCGPENLWDDPYWSLRCAFTDYLPPFDFENAQARAWSIADALWWAQEFGIDGYRLDAIKQVPLRWLQDLRAALNQAFPDPSGGRFYLVGETFTYDDRDLLKSYVDPQTLLDGQFDFPFKARACEALFRPEGSLEHFAQWMGGNDSFYGPGALMTTWIGNHDVPRPIHFASGQIPNCREGSHPGNGWAPASFPQPQDAAPYERLALTYAVMFTNPGIPLLYYGDEIGLAGGGDPDNRRPMIWEDAQLNPHQRALRETVAALGRIRAENKVLARGRRISLQTHSGAWLYRMTGCGEASPDVTVALNKTEAAVSLNLPAGAYEDLLSGAQVGGGPLTVPGRSFLLLRSL